MQGRIKSITTGKSIIGITVLIRAEDYNPLDPRKPVDIIQEPSEKA